MRKISMLLIALNIIFSISIIAHAAQPIVPTLDVGRVLAFEDNFENYSSVDWAPQFDPIIREENGNKYYEVTGYDYLQFPYADKLTNFSMEFNIKFSLSTPGGCWPAFYLKSKGQPSRYEVFLESNPEKEGVNLKKSLKGFVGGTPLKVTDYNEQWCYMKIDITGDTISVFINDKTTPVFTYKDNEPIDCGPMGFVQGGCNYVYLDNVLISVPKANENELTGGEPIPPKSDSVYEGTIADINFENLEMSPFVDETGKSSIIDFNGSKALSVDKKVVLGDKNWKNYSVEFEISIIGKQLVNHGFSPILYHYMDDLNYYKLEGNNVGSIYFIDKYVGGVGETVSQMGVFIGKNNTQKMKIDVFEGKHNLYIDGVNFSNFRYPRTTFEDKSIPSGGIAFQRDEHIEKLMIDNVKVTKFKTMGNVGIRPEPEALYTPKSYPVFSDIENHWAKQDISYLVAKEILNGYEDLTFRPQNNILVNEFLKSVVTALGYEVIPNEISWDLPYIEVAKKNNLISDFDNYNRPIKRREMAEIILKALKITVSDNPVFQAAQLGIMAGYNDGTLGENNNATRADAATMLNRMLIPANRKKPNYNSIALNESEKAFKNPLKGFRGGEYATVDQVNFWWNELEDDVNDGVDKIIAVSQKKWGHFPENNMKAIPRVILQWPPDGKYWPKDMTPGDYTSEQFKVRVENLIRKMGEAWDNDPCVAYVQVGIIGYWGEMQSPYPTVEVQKVLGDAFQKYFKNKRVLTNPVVHFGMFEGYSMGDSWDSYGHWGNIHVFDYFADKQFKDNWKVNPIGGETAFDWGEAIGRNPNDAVLNYKERYIDIFRGTHCNYIGWIANYDKNNPTIAKNAAEIQKVLGYRFVLDKFTYPKTVTDTLDIAFSVTNTGSSPFYYKWPIEISLLDVDTKKPVWKETINDVDIREWLPEDNYSYNPVYSVEHSFKLPNCLEFKEYIIAISILDPEGGMTPSVRFANKNYFNGGRCPVGKIGVGVNITDPVLNESMFDDINSDSITYTPKK